MDNNTFTQEYRDTYNQYIKIGDLFQRDFRFYIELHSSILGRISKKSTEDLRGFFQEIQKKIFQTEFCEEELIEKKKNNFLKIYFETENFRKTYHQLDLFQDEADLCQKASRVVQKHWEFFQYKKEQVTFSDILFLFFEEVEEVLFLWETLTSKLEVFSKIFILNEKQLPKETTTEKFLQVYFLKQESELVDLESIENFITLLKKTNELLLKLQSPQSNSTLRIADIQIQTKRVVIQLVLPVSILNIFQKVVTSLHIDKLQKDGLQKILISIFGAEAIRDVEKKTIISYQRALKEIISLIKKEGNFFIEIGVKQEFSTKVFSLLEKIKQAKFDKSTNTRKSRKNSREYLLMLKSSESLKNFKSIVPPSNKKNQNDTDHIAYLTS